MCEPLSLLAAAGSIAAAGIGYMGQEETLQAQQQANDDWVAYQRKAAADAAAKDEANRQKASAAEQSTLKAVSPETQQQTQQASEADLTSQMLAGSPAAADSNIKLLSGQDQNADTSVSSDISARVTNAARDARGRIAALAGLSSYGGGYGAAGSEAAKAIQSGNQSIALASDMRKGDTATLGVAQQVPVETYAQGSNIAGGIAGSLANIAGSAFGAKMKA